MKYAILNNTRVEPHKDIIGAKCPFCGEDVIPKCGNIKMHHWAHKSKENCDLWREHETEWHRQWKNSFPDECQEFILYDDITKEKHVADVRINELVLEFQHSSISETEQISREKFYKNMFWIIDARKYYENFKTNLRILNHSEKYKDSFYYKYDNYDLNKHCFPERWLNSTVPVVFDFGIHENIENAYDKQKKWLYCVFPQKLGNDFNYTICGMYFTKENFLTRILHNNFSYQDYEKLLLSEIRFKYEKEQKLREKRYKNFLQQKEEEQLRYKETQFNSKFPNEKEWREAIIQLYKDMQKNFVNPVLLNINNKNGNIVDCKNNIYNNVKSMVLAIKSIPKQYKNNQYIENIALLLVQNEKTIFPALIKIPTSIVNGGKSFYFDGILNGKYNYYIRTITTIPYYDKYSVWFEDEERIWSTKYLNKCLNSIRENFY